ncbi:MAG: hypothetical protein CMJ69_06945 [Planctomycetaceae bacterium]|nr:hypothetical protein [Planctomycetaceae bacterium]
MPDIAVISTRQPVAQNTPMQASRQPTWCPITTRSPHSRLVRSSTTPSTAPISASINGVDTHHGVVMKARS